MIVIELLDDLGGEVVEVLARVLGEEPLPPIGRCPARRVDVAPSQRMSSFLNDPTVVSRSVGRVPVGVLPHRRARPRGHRAGRAWPSAGAVEAGRLDTSVLVDME